MIAGILQQGRDCYHVVAQYALVVGMAPLLRRQHFRNIRHTGEMSVYACQQHRPRGRTIGGRVVIGETHPRLRQCRHGRCTDFAAVGGDVGIPEIIGED